MTEDFDRYCRGPCTRMAGQRADVNLGPDDSAPFSSIVWAVSLFVPGSSGVGPSELRDRGNALMAQRSGRRVNSRLRV
jgi:hypothetical protein